MIAFTTIRAVGAALPADLLSATVSDPDLKGMSADDYRLELGITPREAANRAWSVLTGAWAGYQEARAKLPSGDRAVALTREKWLSIVLRELGFGRVPPSPAGGVVADDRAFPVSHVYDLGAGHLPLHLLGWGVPLDARSPGQPGAADRAPHAMLQEYLNRSDDALWGLVSNGRILRLLRDSSTLIGQSYVEFDLESMFEGEVFSDFVVLFLVCHASRFEPGVSEGSSRVECWLERWRTYAAETGTRALEALSPGVKRAIEALGSGFLRHPSNDLHRRIVGGSLSEKDLHDALLRLVYRLLFCFVAEDRGLLFDPAAEPVAKQRYSRWFSTARLRRLSTLRRGSGHGDLWQSLSLVLDGLGREGGLPQLALPGLGGLFDRGEVDVVVGCSLANESLLTAIRHLNVIQPAAGGPKRIVDYRNLGAEELGSVYESLLEYVPVYDQINRTFRLESADGNDRKSSGAYYTPSTLIDCLLDSTLDPLLDSAEREDDAEAALLAVTVCDPACGSGHFLVASARRIAARLSSVRARTTGAGVPSIVDDQRAMHDVVDQCIYGVDLNPMAAELAKVGLWLESVQPGRALSLLNAHIKVGNALLGATPAAMSTGVPDEAFTALDGDDKTIAASLRKRNKTERDGQGSLFGPVGINVSNEGLGEALRAVESLPNTSLADVHLAQRRFREFSASPELQRARAAADAWCAAFIAPKVFGHPAITNEDVQRLAAGQGIDDAASGLLGSLSAQNRFFHWHLEFPQVFPVPKNLSVSRPAGWEGGFACVVGNPPFISPLTASGSRVSPGRNLAKFVRHGLGGPKADESSYFLLLASDLVAGNGRLGLVLPDSFLSSNDSAPLRTEVSKRHDMAMIWRGDGSEFAASVTTIIVSLGPRGTVEVPTRLAGPQFQPLGTGLNVPWRDGSWSPLVASGEVGVETLLGRRDHTMADLCAVTADYRDQYYGLRGAVYDASELDSRVGSDPPLITTGLIDPLVCLWGRTSTKFDKVTYERPLVRLQDLAPSLRAWAAARLVPKLLVATQGRMVEVLIDERGEFLPCVPVISVFPRDDGALTLQDLAAVFLSPAAYEYLRMTKLGSGLSTTAIKVSAADLRSMPAPNDLRPVRAASRLLGRLEDAATRAEFRSLMNEAYVLPQEVGEAWETILASYMDRQSRSSNGVT